MLARQRLHKILQPFQIHPPARRKLKQDRAELFLQQFRARHQVIERLLGIIELDAMRQKPAGLHGKDEILRHHFAPNTEGIFRRQSVKTVVQLYRVKALEVIAQHGGSRQLQRIEPPTPVAIVPTGSANADVARHNLNGWRSLQRSCMPWAVATRLSTGEFQLRAACAPPGRNIL